MHEQIREGKKKVCNMKKDKTGENLVLAIDHNFKHFFKELTVSLTCKVIIMSNHKKACDFFSQNKVDLIILTHSKDHPCLKILKFFKSAKPQVPVIIITACGSEEFAVAVFRCGANDYFNMPIDMDEFKTTVSDVLRKGEARQRRKSDYSIDHFRTALQYINDNCNQKMRLSDVAKEAGMSKSCFERTFKKKMGVTFIAHVNNLRISRSIKLLEEDHFTASEIAYACGFTNQFHFSRMFKKIMNVPPGRYKKSLKD